MNSMGEECVPACQLPRARMILLWTKKIAAALMEPRLLTHNALMMRRGPGFQTTRGMTA